MKDHNNSLNNHKVLNQAIVRLLDGSVQYNDDIEEIRTQFTTKYIEILKELVVLNREGFLHMKYQLNLSDQEILQIDQLNFAQLTTLFSYLFENEQSYAALNYYLLGVYKTLIALAINIDFEQLRGVDEDMERQIEKEYLRRL